MGKLKVGTPIGELVAQPTDSSLSKNITLQLYHNCPPGSLTSLRGRAKQRPMRDMRDRPAVNKMDKPNDGADAVGRSEQTVFSLWYEKSRMRKQNMSPYIISSSTPYDDNFK